MSHEKNKEILRGTFNFVIIMLLVVFVLAGCSTTVPVVAKFPDKPKNVELCPQLDTVKDDVKLSELTGTVAKNYTTYYECAVKVDTWNEWYEIQKHIFEGVSK
jgi:hypothetical protein